MNELIEVLCGIAMCVVVTAPILYYGLWNGLLWLHTNCVEFVTDGDKKVNHDYKDPTKVGMLAMAYMCILFITVLICGAVIFISLMVNDGVWKLVLLAPYSFGVFCSPVISFVLISVVILFGMKYGYKLNKFTKKLNEHVKDKEAHK